MLYPLMQAPPLYAYLSHHASAPSSQSSRSVLVCIQYRIQWRSSSILLLYITMEGAAENECSDLLESSKPGPWPRWLRRTEPLTYVTLQGQGTLEPTEIRTPWRTVVARQIRALATERSFFPANSSKNLSRSACRAAPGRMSFIL